MRKPSSGPGILARIDGLSLAQVVGLGVVIAIANLKNLAIFLTAVAVLLEEDRGPVRLAAGVFAVAVVFCIVPMLPAVVAAVFRDASTQVLASLRARLETRGDRIVVGVLFGFGVLFLMRGLS